MKDKQISLWLSSQELQQLKNKAERAGLTLSGYIRGCTSQKRLTNFPEKQQYDSIALLTEVSDAIISHAPSIGVEEAVRLRGMIYNACGILQSRDSAHGL